MEKDRSAPGNAKKASLQSSMLHGSSDSVTMMARRGSSSLREGNLRTSQKLLSLGMIVGGFTVEVEGFKVTSGLITSYTVYTVRWKFPGTGATGAVEHRYSDFLSLFHHLQKKFPNHPLPPFPEKKRFVTISERDEVAKDRLEIFKAFVKVFEGPTNELWNDSKVHRFFDLPADLRQITSHRAQMATPIAIRKEAAAKSSQQRASGSHSGHRRAGSEMVVVVPTRDSFATMAEPRTLRPSHKPVLANWELDSSALGEIRRSGSDMYLSQVLLGEEKQPSPLSTPVASRKDDSSSSSCSTPVQHHIESTPTMSRASSASPFVGSAARVMAQNEARIEMTPEVKRRSQTEAGAKVRMGTPPSAPGDISPVFARQGLQVVHVPKTMQQERIRTMKDFQIQALLGRGGFGSVFLATETSTGLVVAIKRIAKNTVIRTAKVEQIKMELAVLKQARIKQNRWIVQLHYSFHDDYYLYLAMQFCPGGDLKNFLDNVEMDEKTGRLFAAEICVCVHQLHALGYVHRDLKPDNFLISQRGHLKLADFGLSVSGFLEQKDRRLSSVDVSLSTSMIEEEQFTTLVVYFPPSAAEVRPGGNGDSFSVASPARGGGGGVLDRFDEMVVPIEESSLDEEDDVFALKDASGRRYRRVKIFVTSKTSCNDVLDTLKLRLDIPKQAMYNLLELAFINDHVHERVVRPEELVQGLYASFDRHKFVFKRVPKSVVGITRSRAASNYSDARGNNVVQPLSQSKQRLFQVLGTPNYMAVEILMEQEQGYDFACDWWSVGCIIFELLYGVSPFEASTPEQVFAKILATTEIEFPTTEQPISDSAKSLIRSLIAPVERRLGRTGGLEEVRKHEWFNGIVWGELQYSDPPFLPELESQLDIGYFPSASQANLDQYQSDSCSSSSFSVDKDGLSSSAPVSEATDNWKDFSWSWFT